VLAGAGNTGAVAPPIQRFRRALVVTQFALAMALLVGAGLLMRSFWQLQQASPGFDYENVLSAGVSLNFAQFRELPQRQTIFRRALERVSALPGVESAAGISHLPFGGRTMQHECRLVSQPQREGLVDYRVVTPGLFETLRIPLQRGRGFTERDTHNAAPVCIVNEAFVRAYFANVNPLGEQLRLGFDGGMRGEIIGVVGDLQHRGLEAAAVPTVYVSDLQCGPFSNSPIFNFVLRTRGDALTLAESARQTLQEAAPQQVVFNVRPLNDWVADSLAQRRFSMSLLAAFAALALCLAGAGLAGAMSYLVTQQTREIGLRQALGATRADVLRFVLKQGVGLSLAGIAAGAFAALALTRAMRGLLYGVSANDPGTFLLMALLLLSLALAACVIPARRAMRVDPLTALRHE
jgi:putative ABC transport system permease protein